MRLPKDIKDYMVILMDATVATGAAAMMAIRVLLDHDVPEENILLVSLLMAESGMIKCVWLVITYKMLSTNYIFRGAHNCICISSSAHRYISCRSRNK